MMLFPAVLIVNFPNSEVCLIGEWSINGFYYIGLYYIMAYIILVWLIYRLVYSIMAYIILLTLVVYV